RIARKISTEIGSRGVAFWALGHHVFMGGFVKGSIAHLGSMGRLACAVAPLVAATLGCTASIENPGGANAMGATGGSTTASGGSSGASGKAAGGTGNSVGNGGSSGNSGTSGNGGSSGAVV